jgi:hypothetical protein
MIDPDHPKIMSFLRDHLMSDCSDRLDKGGRGYFVSGQTMVEEAICGLSSRLKFLAPWTLEA